MTAETDLLPLPCPICGNEPRVVDFAGWEVLCQCGLAFADSDCCKERDATVAAWNNRACVSSATEALRRDRDDCLAAREHYAGLYGEQLGRAETLRAQNDAAKEVLNRPAHAHLRGAHLHGPVADCLLCDVMADRAAAKARAERLAEALRRMTGLALDIVPALEATGVNVSLAADVKQAADAARAALEQETTNG